MLRQTGYNVLGYNEAPYNGSGVYAISDSQAVAYDMDAQVVASQSAQFDITEPVGDALLTAWGITTLVALDQAAVWDMRAQVSDTQALSFDDTTPVSDSQAVAWRDTNQIANAFRAAWEVPLIELGGDAGLVATAGHATLTPTGGHATLTRIN